MFREEENSYLRRYDGPWISNKKLTFFDNSTLVAIVGQWRGEIEAAKDGEQTLPGRYGLHRIIALGTGAVICGLAGANSHLASGGSIWPALVTGTAGVLGGMLIEEQARPSHIRDPALWAKEQAVMVYELAKCNVLSELSVGSICNPNRSITPVAESDYKVQPRIGEGTAFGGTNKRILCREAWG